MKNNWIAVALVSGSMVGCVAEAHISGHGEGHGGPRQAAPAPVAEAPAPAPMPAAPAPVSPPPASPPAASPPPASPPPAPIAGSVDGRGGERRDDQRDKRVEAVTGWEKLGERTVNGKADHDTIPVGRAEGRFSAIQLKVEHSALELFDVVVTFADGSSFSPKTKLVFANGQTSRVIDLPGDKRVIRKVDFKYGNLPGGGRAQLELWAH